MKVTAVLCVKNEGSFLLEWLAHHRAVGITDFLVFSNDCVDGTDALLDRLQDMGWLTHVANPGPHPEGPQWAALKQADRHPLVRQADWLITFDIDEFINIHVGERTIAALLAALPEATAIPLTWRLFGNAGVLAIADIPVTESFTRAAPVPLHWPWRAMLFKTLYRNDGSYRKLGVHRPRNPDPDRAQGRRWVDGSGRELPVAYQEKRVFSDIGGDPFRLAQLNHYALGSIEGFLVKCDRGNSFHNGAPLNMDYWVERNFNQEEDRSVLALESRNLRDSLRADPELGRLHAAALAWRKARFRSLMAEDGWRSLYGRLLMTPPTRALSQQEAETIWKPRRPADIVSG